MNLMKRRHIHRNHKRMCQVCMCMWDNSLFIWQVSEYCISAKCRCCCAKCYSSIILIIELPKKGHVKWHYGYTTTTQQQPENHTQSSIWNDDCITLTQNTTGPIPVHIPEKFR